MATKTILNESLAIKEEIKTKPEDVCRFCVEKTSSFSSIFDDGLHESLKDCIGVTIQEADNWPKIVCMVCLGVAQMCIKFINTLRESESKLESLYGELKEIEVKPDIEIVDISQIPVKVELEVDPLQKSDQLKLKIRLPTKNRKQSSEESSDDDSRPEASADEIDSSESEESADEKKRKATKRKRTSIRKGKNQQDSKPQNRMRHRPTKEIAEGNLKKIEEYFKMDCNICPQSYRKLKDLQSHYREVHNREGYVVCCNTKFKRPSKILEHFDHHMNPNAFKCAECGKTFKNKYGLRVHTENSHTPPELHKFKCSHCDKTFMDRNRLKKHSYVHVTDADRNLICPHCSKAFAFKANLQIHIRQIHEEVSYHVCEICAKMFKNKYVYLRHQKTHHEKTDEEKSGETLPRVPCPICGNTFKYKAQLKIHMKRHNESGEVFRCNICNKESPNSRALHEHIKYVHVRERKHKCNLCSAAFKTPIGLREHMATHSYSQILYTCLFCPKQFNSNANMYVHQKRKHPEEYEAMKRKKLQGNSKDNETATDGSCLIPT
ncbi:transcription factor grauzone [Sergentomyia squamirostris]